jgi:hypothetical protein
VNFKIYTMVPIVILVGVVVFISAVVPGISRLAAVQFNQKSALTQVNVASSTGDGKIVNEDAIASFSKLDHVVAASADYVATVSSGISDDPSQLFPALSFTAHTWRTKLGIPLVGGGKIDQLAPGQVILPQTTQGQDLSGYLGKTIPLEYTRMIAEGTGEMVQFTAKVVGIADKSWKYDGPEVLYGSADDVVKWNAARSGITPADYRRTKEPQDVLIIADDVTNVNSIVTILQQQGYLAKPLANRFNQLPPLVTIIQGLGTVLAWLAIVAAALLQLSSALQSTKSRLTEFAVHRINGRTVGQLRLQLVGESVLTGVLSGLLAGLIGVVGAYFASGPLAKAFDYDSNGGIDLAQPLTVGILIPVFGGVIGSALGSWKALRKDPYLLAWQKED